MLLKMLMSEVRDIPFASRFVPAWQLLYLLTYSMEQSPS